MKETDQEQHHQPTQLQPNQEPGNPHYKASPKLEANGFCLPKTE